MSKVLVLVLLLSACTVTTSDPEWRWPREEFKPTDESGW